MNATIKRVRISFSDSQAVTTAANVEVAGKSFVLEQEEACGEEPGDSCVVTLPDWKYIPVEGVKLKRAIQGIFEAVGSFAETGHVINIALPPEMVADISDLMQSSERKSA